MKRLKLDLQFFAGEKTEKATPRKRQEVRQKGQVAKSADVVTAATLFLMFLSFLFFGHSTLSEMLTLLHITYENYLLMELSEDNIHVLFESLTLKGFWIITPFMIVAIISSLIGNMIQVGFIFSTEPLKMKLNKINPIHGFQRIFSLRAIVELLKSMVKISFIGAVTFFVLWFRFDEILTLPNMSVEDAFLFLSKLTLQMGLFASGALLLLSIFDYLYQKYDFEKNIRMSKQDIKDEQKKMEGDPLIKSRIKQRQREIAMRRMMQDVPKADVVITNPTHYAVALKYDPKKMDAPYVLAKGTDFLAQKIKQIANQHDVVTVENRPLARSLYDQTEIGEAIPEQFFKAVAEIIAYVYRLKQKV
ncbi:flagellar biosynthesis protein FlhB [Bacillus alveayuensis]|uniref:Flagellar biosynthetic protein FlhB n=1 Tax=Aeribacillus alveayuensis TaxID=279215 RepID=A0ABT9VLA3_9BACI|nr:flagellar biosynthesis protein FlhB [Bacillus alveayuensis]MDQ0161751.1 flagellar biosynthetic protein FlhB [Bacillus alveayuensis]